MSLETSGCPQGRPRLWLAAVALSALPMVYGWVMSLLASPQGYGVIFMMTGTCPGSDLATDVRAVSLVSWLLTRPILVVNPGFRGLGARGGCRR